jgi:uncharacterized protein (TIGR03067 family)
MSQKTIRLAASVVIVAAGAAAVAASPGRDADRLQGHWEMSALVVNGEKRPAELIKSGKLDVKGERYTVDLGGSVATMTVKLDETKTPKQIELTPTEGDQKGKPSLGIYKIEGDTFTMCRESVPNGKRPTAFASPAGAGQILVSWRRTKS